MSKIIMFDMDGTLLDLAFDDFIWNECLPKRHAEIHQLPLDQSQKHYISFINHIDIRLFGIHQLIGPKLQALMYSNYSKNFRQNSSSVWLY